MQFLAQIVDERAEFPHVGDRAEHDEIRTADIRRQAVRVHERLLIAFEVDGGMEMGLALMNRLKLVTRAVTLPPAPAPVAKPGSAPRAPAQAGAPAQH